MVVIALTLLIIILMILLALGCDKLQSLNSLPLPRSDGMVVIPQPTSFPPCGGWCLDKVLDMGDGM